MQTDRNTLVIRIVRGLHETQEREYGRQKKKQANGLLEVCYPAPGQEQPDRVKSGHAKPNQDFAYQQRCHHHSDISAFSPITSPPKQVHFKLSTAFWPVPITNCPMSILHDHQQHSVRGKTKKKESASGFLFRPLTTRQSQT